MSTQTANYGFEKPATTDYYDITKYNSFLDSLDTLLAASVKVDQGYYVGAGVHGLGEHLCEIPIKKGAVPLRLEIMRRDALGDNQIPAPSGNVGGVARAINFKGLSDQFEIAKLYPIYLSGENLRWWDGNTIIRRAIAASGTTDKIEFYCTKIGASDEDLVHYQMNVLGKYYYWTLYYIDGAQS